MRKGAILLLVLSLVLVACRASTADTTLSPTDRTRPTSLLTEAEYPVTVQTDSGPVIIEGPPERVVSLSATATEMLYALGAGGQVVATDLTSNYPDAAGETVKLDAFNFNVEEVAALDPDLVILAFDFQGEGAALSALSIPFLLLGPPADIESSLSQLQNIGLATGHYPEAEALAARLSEEMASLVARSRAGSARGIVIYHEVDETLYSTTSASFIGNLYSRLGLVNIADGIDDAGAFPQLSSEFIVEQNPQFIFLGDANFGVTAESVAARPGWDTITAVRDGNVVALDGDIAGRWGPRTVDLVAAILDAVEDGLS
jgi:iron complex transport system substrate-binding protein